MRIKNSLILIIAVFFLSNFFIYNFSSAATTCEQKHLGYGQCATDCASLGIGYLLDAETPGLCTTGSCCYKTGGSADSADSLELQIPIFDKANVNSLPEYIATIYRYLIIILVPLAIIMIIVGGVSWILAAGDSGKIGNAKKYITAAFSGLIIGLFSYVILSLVGIETLTMPGIQKIEPERGDILYFDGIAYSAAEGNSKLPVGRRGDVNQFQNAACPTQSNPTFQVYFTDYYTPALNDKLSYGSFGCNVATQCQCPKGYSGGPFCWGGTYACTAFPSSFVPGKDYCDHTASGRPPVGNYTIAGDIPRDGRRNACFKLGCKLMIEGKGPYEIMDTGGTSHIIGLHMDYYDGLGRPQNPTQGVYTVTVTNPASCLH